MEAAHHRSHGRQRKRQVFHQRRPHLLLRLRGRTGGARRRRVPLTFIGRVTFQLGLDQAVVGAVTGERVDDRPAQVGVDLEAGKDLDAVEHSADHRDVLRRAGRIDEGLRPGELEVAAGGRPVQRSQGVGGKCLLGGVGVRRIAIDPDGGGGLGEQILDDPDIGLAVDVVEDQRQVAARRKLAVAEHVPERRPDDRPRQWIGQLSQVLAGRLQRLLVQANLRVGQVQVIDEHQVREAFTNQVGYRCVCLGNIQLDPSAQL